MTRWIALFSVVCASAMLGACGDDDDPGDDRDAGPDGGGSGRDGGGPPAGSGGRGGSGGAGAGGGGTGGTTPEPVECGGETCVAPMGGLGTACCTDDDACGINSMLAPGMCLPLNAPGGIDTSCPNYDVMSGLATWYGCCTPEGECGALATFGGLGCIPNSTLMAPPQSCDYDPSNTCERLFEVNCDGPEDCSNGQQCCGHYDGGYRSFHCADDCAAEQVEQGGTWSEVCHPGQTCQTPDGGAAAYMCLANVEFLPDYLYRCRDTGTEPTESGSTAAGEINCGENVCGSGQKCCISVPGLAICVPSDQECTCVTTEPDDAGTEDAGN